MKQVTKDELNKELKVLTNGNGLISIDQWDIDTILSFEGEMYFSTGYAKDVKDAMDNALGELIIENKFKKAKGITIIVQAGDHFTFDDFDSANRLIHEYIHEDAFVLMGAVIQNHENLFIEDYFQIKIGLTGV